MSTPSRFHRPNRNLSAIFHHGRRAAADAPPDLLGFERVPEQLWECACGKVRQWGHGEAEGVSHEAYLLCWDCEGHTLHAYAGVAE